MSHEKMLKIDDFEKAKEVCAGIVENSTLNLGKRLEALIALSEKIEIHGSELSTKQNSNDFEGYLGLIKIKHPELYEAYENSLKELKNLAT